MMMEAYVYFSRSVGPCQVGCTGEVLSYEREVPGSHDIMAVWLTDRPDIAIKGHVEEFYMLCYQNHEEGAEKLRKAFEYFCNVERHDLHMDRQIVDSIGWVNSMKLLELENDAIVTWDYGVDDDGFQIFEYIPSLRGDRYYVNLLAKAFMLEDPKSYVR